MADSEESAEDAARRFARLIERLRNFINDPENTIVIWGSDDGVVRIKDIERILESDE